MIGFRVPRAEKVRNWLTKIECSVRLCVVSVLLVEIEGRERSFE